MFVVDVTGRTHVISWCCGSHRFYFIPGTYSADVTLSVHVQGYPYPYFRCMVPGIYSTIMFTFDHRQQRTQIQHTHATTHRIP